MTRYIGKYRVEGILGTGSYSKVYKVSYRGKKYAIKSVKESFLQEWTFLRMLSHPNIVRPYESIWTDESMHIVMPKMALSLQDMKKRDGDILEKDLRTILWQVFSALDYLHANHIVHRDLKADNIMLASHDGLDVRIIDFGISKYLYPGRQDLWSKVPSVSLRAPEVYEHIYSPAMDMWSIGMTIFNLLLPRYFFLIDEDRNEWSDAETIKRDILQGRIHDHIRTLSISELLRNLLLQLLNMNHESRITASNAMHHQWFGGLSYSSPRIIVIPTIHHNLPDRYVSSLSNVSIRHGYEPSMTCYATKIASKIYTSNPQLLDRQIEDLLLSIAATQMDEDAYYGRRIRSMFASARYDGSLLFDVFKALDYSLIVL